MNRHFKITVDGHEYDVTVEELPGEAGSLYPDARTMRSETAPPVAPQTGAAPSPTPPAPLAQAAPGDVVSPLAGIVVSVNVAVGEPVQADTIVVTLEAMKTKTSVAAGSAGKVESIAVQAEQGVDAGQLLLKIG